MVTINVIDMVSVYVTMTALHDVHVRIVNMLANPRVHVRFVHHSVVMIESFTLSIVIFGCLLYFFCPCAFLFVLIPFDDPSFHRFSHSIGVLMLQYRAQLDL
jgi:hypothetical protein